MRTRVGTLNLLVPQDREGTFSTRLFSRYQRNEKALCLALMEMYVEGVSTRKVKEVTEELCGTSFSKSLVSQLAGSLDSELSAWRDRRVEAEAYPYVFVDARYEKVRVDGRVVSQGVLIVSGVRDDGFREILAVEVSDTESEATYQELFRSLKRRGLSGVQLVVSDEHEGLKSAIARHFQGASHQRCQVHYARNLLGMVGHARRKELASDLRAIFAAPERKQALTIAASVAGKWRKKGNEKVAEHLEEHIEECLSCLAFPESHRRRIRTTNGLERLNQEIKRRTRVVRIFPNERSCLRLVSALGGGAIGGVDHGEALPGHGGARRTLPRREARSREGDSPRNDEVRMSLEETTENSGLDRRSNDRLLLVVTPFALSAHHYSPECVELEFSEVHIQDPA